MRSVTLPAVGVVSIAMVVSANASPVRFSLDRESPTLIANGFATGDVLAEGPILYTAARDLGIGLSALDGLSYGVDVLIPGVYFSVDRFAVGLPGSPVNERATAGAPVGADIYSGPVGVIRGIQRTAESLGFAAGDNITSLEVGKANAHGPSPFTYFSVDASSATTLGNPTLAGSILKSLGVRHLLGLRHASEMGLQPGDDIDALVGFFGGLGLTAWFSLSPASPSTFTRSGAAYAPGVKGAASPGDVLTTSFNGAFGLRFSAASLGLRPEDNVDALDAVPEPTSLVLVGSGALFALTKRLRRRST